MTMDIPVSILTELKQELYKMSMSGNGLSDYPRSKEFYQDITDILAGIE